MSSSGDEAPSTAPPVADPRTRSQIRDLCKPELVALVEEQAAALRAHAEEARQRDALAEQQAAAIRELQLKVESLSASAASSPLPSHVPPVRLGNNEGHNTPAETSTALATGPQPRFELAQFRLSILDTWIEQAKAFVAQTDPSRVLGTLLKAFTEEDFRTYFQNLVRIHTLTTGPDWPNIWEALRMANTARRTSQQADFRRAIAAMKLPASYDETAYDASVSKLLDAAQHGVSYHTLREYLLERLPPHAATSPVIVPLSDDTPAEFFSWYKTFLIFGSCTHCGRFGHAKSGCLSRNRRNPKTKHKQAPKTISTRRSPRPSPIRPPDLTFARMSSSRLWRNKRRPSRP